MMTDLVCFNFDCFPKACLRLVYIRIKMSV